MLKREEGAEGSRGFRVVGGAGDTMDSTTSHSTSIVGVQCNVGGHVHHVSSVDMAP